MSSCTACHCCQASCAPATCSRTSSLIASCRATSSTPPSPSVPPSCSRDLAVVLLERGAAAPGDERERLVRRARRAPRSVPGRAGRRARSRTRGSALTFVMHAERRDQHPQQRDQRRAGGHQQADVEPPRCVAQRCAKNWATTSTASPSRRPTTSSHGKPPALSWSRTPAGSPRGRAARGRQQLGAHQVRRLALVGRADRQALVVVRARRLHESGVDGQLADSDGERAALPASIGRLAGGDGDGERGLGLRDVVLVPGALVGRLLTTGQEGAGRGGVRVGERAVDVLCGDAQRAAAGGQVVERVPVLCTPTAVSTPTSTLTSDQPHGEDRQHAGSRAGQLVQLGEPARRLPAGRLRWRGRLRDGRGAHGRPARG